MPERLASKGMNFSRIHPVVICMWMLNRVVYEDCKNTTYHDLTDTAGCLPAVITCCQEISLRQTLPESVVSYLFHIFGFTQGRDI